MNLKKIIALVLCVCMVLSFFPVSVFAEEWVEDEAVLVDEEEYYEPQDEYYEEEILEEEPADYVEYVEPEEEIVVEDELPAEEPAEEPAQEPAEEPAAELKTAETLTFNSGVIIVAECDGKSYTSLQDAIDENAGKTITVVKDCGLDEGAEALNVRNNVTIEGGAHTFTGAVNITADATISNITFNDTVTVNGGSSTISNATFKADPGVVLNEGALTLQTNLKFEGIYSVKVNGGTLTIPEGETSDFGVIDAASGVSGNVKGGKFSKAMYIPAALIAPGYAWDETEGGVIYKGCAKNATTGKFYMTLAEAVEEAGDGDTIKLLIDIEADLTTVNVTNNGVFNIEKNITIDGNGNTIRAVGTTGLNVHVFNVTSPATIKNVTIVGNGNNKMGIHAYGFGGTGVLTLENVTTTNNYGYGVCANGAVVAATSLNTSGNGWGGVNVDHHSENKPAGFTLNGGTVQSLVVENTLDGSTAPITAEIEAGTVSSIIIQGKKENIDKIEVKKSADVNVPAPEGYAWNDAGKLVKLWTVSFYNEAGTAKLDGYSDQYVKDGEYATKPSVAPHIAGYNFAAWVTIPNCPAADIEANTYHFGGSEATEADKITADKNLYARFTRNRYDLTYDPNGGYWATPTDTKNTDPKVSSLGYNDAVTAAEEVKREGYTFNGWDWSWTDEEQVEHKGVWNGTAIDPAAPEKMPAGNLTFKAHWTINSYDVTFNPNGGKLTKADGSETTESYTESYDFDATVAYPTATKDGYTFSKWYGNGTTAPEKMPAASMSVKPIWTADDASIVFDAGEGAVIPKHDEGSDYTLTITGKTDEPVTYPANSNNLKPTKDGYQYAGWFIKDTDTQVKISELPTKMPANGVSYEAHWTANNYTVKFNKNNAAATGEMANQSFTYDEDAKALSENAFELTGYTFAGWYFDAECTDEKAVPATVQNLTKDKDGEVNVYAKWTANEFKVKFEANEVGTGTMADLDLTYDQASATLPPVAFGHTGYSFIGWAFAPDATTAIYTNEFNLLTTHINALYNRYRSEDGFVHLYAIWQANEYTLTYQWDTVEGVIQYATHTDFPYNSVLPTDETLPEFVDYWYIPADGDSGNTSEPKQYHPGVDKYNVEGDMTLVAHYKVFTATFDAKDGAAVGPTTYNAITKAELPATTRDKYTFKGWKVISTSDDGNWTLDEIVPPGNYAQMTGDVTFEAQWKFNEAQLTDGTDNSVPYETIALAKAEYDNNSSHYRRGIEILDPDAVYPLAYGATLVVYEPGDWSPVPDETDTENNYYITKSAADAYGAVTFSTTDNVAQLAEIKWTVTRDAEWNYHAVPEINVIGSYADFASAADQAKDQTGNLNPEEAGTYIDKAVILLANNKTTYPLNAGEKLTVLHTGQNYVGGVTGADGVRAAYAQYDLSILEDVRADYAFTYTGVQQWTVTFMVGEETYKTVTVDDGKSIEATQVVDPEVPGLTFTGWFDGETELTWPYTPMANVTFVAAFTENENTVIYNANGGTVKDEAGNMVKDFSITADYKSAIYAPNQEGYVVREGYDLRGWYLPDVGLIQPADLPTMMPAAQTTTYTASWQIQKHTVTFTKEDGSALTDYTYTDVDYGTEKTAPAATLKELKKTGYTLTSFVNTEDETDVILPGTTFTIPASDKTYKAVYTPNEFTITLTKYNGEGDDVVVSATYNQGVTLPATGFTRTGYHYTALNNKATGDGTDYAEASELSIEQVNALMPKSGSGNTNLYAHWVADEFNIAFAEGDGEGTMEPMTAKYDTPAALPANAFTKTGYSFANWSIGGMTFKNKAQLTADDVNALYAAAEDGVATLTANYKANTYKVTFDKNGADGTETMSALSVVYDGAAVQIPDSAFTYTGYSFTGWNTQADGNGDPYSVGAEVSNLTANLKLYAQWQINTYTIKYANVPEDYVGPTSYTVESVKPSGQEIPDPSKTGANFKGWTITITNGDTVTTVELPHDKIPASGAILGNRVYTAKFNDYVAQLTDGTGAVTPFETIADAKTAYFVAPTSYHGIEIIDPAAVYEMTTVGDEIVVLNPGDWTPVDKCVDGHIVASDPDEFDAVTFTMEQSVAQVANVKWTWTRNADWTYSFAEPQISVVADYATFAEAADAAKNKSGTWTPSGTTGEHTDTVVIMLMSNEESYTNLSAGDVLTVNRGADNYTTKITRHDGVRYDDHSYPSVEGAANLTDYHRYTAVQQYTVTFMNGNEKWKEFTVDAGESITHDFVDPVVEGKTFDNWYNNGTAIKWDYTPMEDVTFDAVYTNKSNKVIYKANGGTVIDDEGNKVNEFSITADYESDIYAPNQEGDVVREGYDLRGWNLPDVGLIQPANLPTKMPAAQTTTYTASWRIQKHTVTFTKEDGSALTDYTFIDVNYGTEETAPDVTLKALKKTGYTLTSFVNTEDETDTIQPGATFTIPASDKTYKAVYTANTFTIKLNANNDDATVAPVEVPVTYDQGVTLPATSFTKIGYHYTALNTQQGGTGTDYDEGAELSAAQVNALLPRSGSIANLYANWVADTFQIAFDKGEGEGTMEPMTATYDATATLNANTYTKTGHSFANWSNGDTTFRNKATLTKEQVNALYAEATEVGGVKTATLTANFKANTYKVTFDKNSEDATGTMAALSVPYGGGAVTIPASGFTLTGYKFSSWNTKADGSGDTYNVGAEVENLTANLTLYEQWVDDTFDVIFVANNGTEEKLTALEDLTYGSSAKLPKNEFTKAGAEFQGWAFTDDAAAVVYVDEFELKATHTQALYNSYRNEEDGNVYLYGVWDSKVAQVGEVFYDTFAEAAKAAIADENAPTVLLWSMPDENDRLGVNDNWEGTLTVENAGSVEIDVETLVTARADYKLVKATTGTTTTFTSTQYEASTVDGTGKTIYIETLKEAIEDYAMVNSNYVVRLIKNNLSYVVPADTADNVTFKINKNGKNVTVTHEDPNKYINEADSGDNTIYSIVAYVASVTVDTYEMQQQPNFSEKKVLVNSVTTLYDDFGEAYDNAVTSDPSGDELTVKTLNLITAMSVDKELAEGTMIRLADKGMTNKLVAPEGYRLNPTETETTGVTLYRLQQVYAISYDLAGGVNPDANLKIVSFNPADDSITFAMPTKEHYHGGKWRVGYTDGGTYIATLTDDEPALTVTNLNGAITLTAQYEIDTYEVTFLNDDGGPVYQKVGKQLVEVEPQTVNHGAVITPVTPFKEGYKFSGWTKDGAAFDDATPITEATTLSASWTIKTYNIQFWDDDTKIITHKGTYGDLIERPAATEIPERENYTFDAWYKDKELTELFDFDVETVGAGTVNIYAKYLPVDYTLTLALDGGELPASWTQGTTIKYNVESESITLPLPTKGADGDYMFTGWTDEDESVVVTFVPADYLRDVTLTAGWKGLPVEIFFVDTLNTKMIANKQLAFNSLVKDGAPTYAEVLEKVGTYPDHKTLDPNDLWVDMTDETRVSKDNDTYNLNWKNLYDIPFTMSGVTFKTVPVMEGDTISESVQPSVKNAQDKQANWLINGEEGKFFFFDKTPVDGTIENLEATWTEPVTYTVTFMDGEDVYAEVPVIAGEKVAKPEDPTKEGWSFVAWLKDGVAFDFDTPINESIVLDASWEEVIVNYVETRYSMNITSSFAINYYVKPLVGEASDYEVSFNGGEYVAVTSGKTSRYGYAFTNIGSFNANEMLVTVPVSIRYQGEEVKTEEPSIRGYCDKAFASGSEDLIVKCEAALDYGSSAQEYAGETDPAALANGGTYFDVLGLDVEEVGEVIGEPITGITGAKSSVTMGSEISLNLYVVHSKKAVLSDYTFKLDGKAVDPAKVADNGKMFGIQVGNVKVTAMDSEHTLEVIYHAGQDDEETFAYTTSCLSYLYKANTVGSIAMQKVSYYLYNFYMACEGNMPI